MGFRLGSLNLKIENQIKDSGYQGKDRLLDRVMDILISSILLLIISPVLLLLVVIVKLQDRGPVFYRGIRYGLDKKEFFMYKFRTLVPDAEQIIGGRLLKSSMGLETGIGKILRDTRLDELPQLFNVIRGDMSLIGPRPERPAVYEKMCKDIPNYDLRFGMKPGLIGYSQLFTPHSANKKLRARIDNHYSRCESNSKNNYIFILYAFGYLGLIAARKVFKSMLGKARLYTQVKRMSDKRESTRIKFFLSYYARLIVYVTYSANIDGKKTDGRFSSFVFDVNDKYITIITDYELPKEEDKQEIIAKFIVHSTDRLFERRKRRHIILCKITNVQLVTRRSNYNNSYRYLLAYEPVSELYRYRMDKYVLKKSIM